MTSAIDAKRHVLDPLLAVMVVAVEVGVVEDMVATITVAVMVVGIDDAAGLLTEGIEEIVIEGVVIAEVGAESDGDKLSNNTCIPDLIVCSNSCVWSY